MTGVAMTRKRNFLAVASVFLAFCVAPAFPQGAPPPKAAAKEEALPSVDELVAKCAKASGGKEAWAKLSTQVLDGSDLRFGRPAEGSLPGHESDWKGEGGGPRYLYRSRP